MRIPNLSPFSLSRLLTPSLGLGLLILILSPSFWPISPARAATPYIAVGTAKIKKAVIAFPDIRTQKPVERALATIAHDTFVSDLEFMNSFSFLKPQAFVEDTSKAGILPNTFK